MKRTIMKKPKLNWSLGAFILCCLGLTLGACSSKQKLTERGKTCLINSDCEGELICKFESCEPRCVVTRDCEGTETCVGEKNSERVCLSEASRLCSSQQDCPEGLSCAADGRCHEGCFDDGDCATDQDCISSVCVDKNEQAADGGFSPVEGNTIECLANRDCLDGRICSFGHCAPQCAKDKDCPSGKNCEDGACLYPGGEICQEDSQCSTAGESCERNQCRCECLEDVDCASGSCDGCACQNSTAACTLSTDCTTAGQQCLGGECRCECQFDFDCGKNAWCDGCGCHSEAPPKIVDGAAVFNSIQLNAISGVTHVLENLTIYGAYPNLDPLKELRSVQGDLQLLGIPFEDLSFLSNLEEVGGTMRICGSKLDKLDIPFANIRQLGTVIFECNEHLTMAEINAWANALFAKGLLVSTPILLWESGCSCGGV